MISEYRLKPELSLHSYTGRVASFSSCISDTDEIKGVRKAEEKRNRQQREMHQRPNRPSSFRPLDRNFEIAYNPLDAVPYAKKRIMLKCASVYTCEIDDFDAALSEIKAQLEQKMTLLNHSVGIIMCHPEFTGTGILEHLSENLPFDLAGVTTASQAVNDQIGELILTVFVMTSDDIVFKTGVTEALGSDVDGAVKTAYDKTITEVPEMSEQPRLALLFPPFGQHAGDAYIRAWEKIIPGTPLFGTHAIDDTAIFKECRTIYNGQHYETAMPFVLCYGNIHPRFMIATFSEDSAVSAKVEITKAKGNCLQEINHAPAIEYFKKMGIADISFMTAFMFDFSKHQYDDNTPVVRGFASFTEEGAATFYGEVEDAATFAFLKWDTDILLSATSQKISEINGMSGVNGVLFFPCTMRRAVLLGASRPLLEFATVKEHIKQEIPFMMGDAGGEICPTSVRDGVPLNRFHNYSLVILIV